MLPFFSNYGTYNLEKEWESYSLLSALSFISHFWENIVCFQEDVVSGWRSPSHSLNIGAEVPPKFQYVCYSHTFNPSGFPFFSLECSTESTLLHLKRSIRKFAKLQKVLLKHRIHLENCVDLVEFFSHPLRRINCM